LLSACTSANLSKTDLKEQKALGDALFHDKALSVNNNEACATCHNPKKAFTDNRGNGVNNAASLGSNGKSIGNRSAPPVTYALFSPRFHYDKKKQEYIGGQFWDGRAPTEADQAGAPPTNPGEMGMKDKSTLMKKLEKNPYYKSSFKKLYGSDIFKNSNLAYLKMTEAIQAYEHEKKFYRFDSKYDKYLRDEYMPTELEDLGISLFFSNNNTSCSKCHMLKGEDRQGETFTNYQYRNIGIPINKQLRSKNGIALSTIDNGLYQNPLVHKDPNTKGKFKTPSLRNVAITGPYMHNGIFKHLRTVIEFYDHYNNPKRKINPETHKPWAKPQYPQTVAYKYGKKELRAKPLNERKIKALVAFLRMLTDKRYEYLLKK